MAKSTYVEGNSRTFKSTNDLSAKQFFIVKLDTGNDNQIVLSAAATDKHVGILLNTPKAGDTADVYLRNAAGTSKVVAGGTIAINDALTSDANGKAVATTTAADQVIGYSLHAAASGDIVEFAPSGFTLVR